VSTSLSLAELPPSLSLSAKYTESNTRGNDAPVSLLSHPLIRQIPNHRQVKPRDASSGQTAHSTRRGRVPERSEGGVQDESDAEEGVDDSAWCAQGERGGLVGRGRLGVRWAGGGTYRSQRQKWRTSMKNQRMRIGVVRRADWYAGLQEKWES
jgi:hypothetical protein